MGYLMYPDFQYSKFCPPNFSLLLPTPSILQIGTGRLRKRGRYVKSKTFEATEGLVTVRVDRLAGAYRAALKTRQTRVKHMEEGENILKKDQRSRYARIKHKLEVARVH